MDWINVHTELPKPGEEVLVAATGIGDYYPIYDIGYREPGGDHKWMLYGGTISEITHWMPLPEAPQLPCWINGSTCGRRLNDEALTKMRRHPIKYSPPVGFKCIEDYAEYSKSLHTCKGCWKYEEIGNGKEVPVGYWEERK